MLIAFVAAIPFVLVPVYAIVPPPVSALMLIRLAEGQGRNYRWIPVEQVSHRLVQAVVMSEDARFCQHNGVDWAVLQDLVGGAVRDGSAPSRGGSTIAMQTAKNLFLWPQRSYLRKGLEIPLSLWIDLVWPKQRVVEVYLNIAEWGPGIYGAEAASRAYFRKPAARLTASEASLLAASLPNPLHFNPAKPSRQLSRRARTVRARMKAAGGHLGCLDTARTIP